MPVIGQKSPQVAPTSSSPPDSLSEELTDRIQDTLKKVSNLVSSKTSTPAQAKAFETKVREGLNAATSEADALKHLDRMDSEIAARRMAKLPPDLQQRLDRTVAVGYGLEASGIYTEAQVNSWVQKLHQEIANTATNQQIDGVLVDHNDFFSETQPPPMQPDRPLAATLQGMNPPDRAKGWSMQSFAESGQMVLEQRASVEKFGRPGLAGLTHVLATRETTLAQAEQANHQAALTLAAGDEELPVHDVQTAHQYDVGAECMANFVADQPVASTTAMYLNAAGRFGTWTSATELSLLAKLHGATPHFYSVDTRTVPPTVEGKAPPLQSGQLHLLNVDGKHWMLMSPNRNYYKTDLPLAERFNFKDVPADGDCGLACVNLGLNLKSTNEHLRRDMVTLLLGITQRGPTDPHRVALDLEAKDWVQQRDAAQPAPAAPTVTDPPDFLDLISV